MKVTVYGASDDLVEVEGDLSEEFSWIDNEAGGYLCFSDGTLASITYGSDGAYWRINVLVDGTAKSVRVPATDEESDYSDKLTLDGDVRWVALCRSKEDIVRSGRKHTGRG